MIKLLFPLTVLFYFSCTPDKDGDDLPPGNYKCSTLAIQNNYSRAELIDEFDESILQGIASIDVPNSEGAMGRNKNGYFHVRFQTGLSAQADYAVHSESTQALEYAVKAIEYAFEYQLEDGNFDLIVPESLAGQTPGEADIASGVSFFLSSLGLALNNFEESSWYNSSALSAYKNRVETLRPKIESAATWLLTQKDVLGVADQNAPNRLLFNALAFYSIGKWLNNSELRETGISFANSAILKKHPNGYFIENNGWDSSYQGVAINVGFNLYSLLPETEDLKGRLWDCLSCAADWQKSRTLESGEISTEGNTRVYSGGEDFLGREKDVDWVDTMVGFFMMGYYSSEPSYESTAEEILDFYL